MNVDKFFDATEAVVGARNSYQSGIIFAVPVTAARGLDRDAGPG